MENLECPFCEGNTWLVCKDSKKLVLFCSCGQYKATCDLPVCIDFYPTKKKDQ